MKIDFKIKKNFSLVVLLIFLLQTILAPLGLCENQTRFKKIISEQDFRDATGLYLESFEKGDLVSRAVYSKRLVDFVFQDPGSDLYKQSLLHLEDISNKNPEAIYALLKHMQNRWESTYSSLLLLNWKNKHTQKQNKEKALLEGTAFGTIAWIVSGIALIKRPDLLPKYFSIVRSLFPAVGLAGGAICGETESKLSDPLSTIPPSPAHLLKLGIEKNQEIFNGDDLELNALLLGLATGSASVLILPKILSALKVINQATTPLKINLLVLVGSFLVSWGVEEGSKSLIQTYELHKLQESIEASIFKMDKAELEQNDFRYLLAADTLAHLAQTYSKNQSQAVLQEIERFLTKLDELKKSQSDLNALIQNFENTLTQVLGSSEELYDHGYESFQILKCLILSEDPYECARHRGTEASLITRTYLVGARARVETVQWQIKDLTEVEKKDIQKKFYIESIIQLDRAVSLMLREGEVRRHPYSLLFQTAAMFRASEKEYLFPKAEELMAQAARSDFFNLLFQIKKEIAGTGQK